MIVLRIKNWAKFQHYKHRRPPWIKLHRELLDDCDFQCLPLASKALAPMLWLLASECGTDGIIRMESRHLAFRLRVAEADLLAALDPLMNGGFFEDASGVLAPCVQPATPEYREQSTETEKTSSFEACAPNPEKSAPVSIPSKTADRLAALLKAEILRNVPAFKITAAQERNWAKAADRMIRLDNRTEEEISALIRWAQRDEFEMSNVLSMEKLRKRFDQLALKRGRNSSSGSPSKADKVSKWRREFDAKEAAAQ